MEQPEDRTQAIRALSLVLGASLGLAGMTTKHSWLVYVGLGVLAIGAVLAIVRRIQIRKRASP